MNLTRHIIDTSVEKRILTGLIVSSKFCRKALSMINPQYLEIEYSRIILRWVSEYYKEYQQAPGLHIQHIFESKKIGLSAEIEDLVGSFLSDLSEKYSAEDEEKFNVDYLMDQLREHIRSKNLLRISNAITTSIQTGKIEQAEKEIEAYKSLTKATSKWVNPFDDFFIDEVLAEAEEYLFKFPGRLNELMPTGLMRDWLVGFMGPMKRGKSWWLMEVAVQALLTKLKVAFISLEMRDKRVALRIFKRLTALSKEGGMFRFPVFDCSRNQEGSCKMGKRRSMVRLLTQDGFIPSFERAPKNYLPCTVCRGKDSDDFIPASWFTSIRRDPMTLSKLKKGLRGFSDMWGVGNNFRLIAYPAYSANLKNVKADLEELEMNDGFVPDVIVVDYADILSPEDDRDTGRDKYDRTWKTLKGMAGQRYCLIVTATQSNKKTLDSRSVKSSDVSEDIRKFAHVDAMFGIHQTPQEKKRGIIRLSVLGLRDDDFDSTQQITVLQDLSAGQTVLDSEVGVLEDPLIPTQEEEGI
uniref:Putative helicase n=1 Tax=viral metagenome TaxID=1070528 RepID=A0A6M3IJZ0_9ZZZZ